MKRPTDDFAVSRSQLPLRWWYEGRAMAIERSRHNSSGSLLFRVDEEEEGESGDGRERKLNS